MFVEKEYSDRIYKINKIKSCKSCKSCLSRIFLSFAEDSFIKENQ